MNDSARTALEQRIAEAIRTLGLMTDRIGHTFASRQGLHPTDFRALSLIYQAERAGDPLTASALARQLNLGGPATTYAVDRLVASGHVFREKDAADRRRVVLRHAPHGFEVASDFFVPLGLRHHGALERFSDADLASFLRVLDAVVAAMAEHQATLAQAEPEVQP